MNPLRVLVTGGSGFIGANLVPSLLAAHDVEAVLSTDIVPPRNPAQAGAHQHLDVTDRRAVAEIVRTFSPTHLVHMAARTDLRGTTVSDYAVNYAGTRHVLDAAAAQQSPPRTLCFSSRLVFRIDRPPQDPFDYSATTDYGVSKVLAEQVALGYDTPWVLLRPTSLWGPYFSTPYADFFTAVRRGRYVHPSNRPVIRKQFGFVGNAVHQIAAVLRAPDDDVLHRPFWLADYEALDVLSWAREIAAQLGVREPRQVPLAVLRVAALLGDRVDRTGRSAPITTFRLNNLVTDMLYDVSATRELAGSLPYTTSQGTALTAAWLRDSTGGAA